MNDTRILETFACAKHRTPSLLRNFNGYGCTNNLSFEAVTVPSLQLTNYHSYAQLDWSFTKQNLITNKVEKFEIRFTECSDKRGLDVDLYVKLVRNDDFHPAMLGSLTQPQRFSTTT